MAARVAALREDYAHFVADPLALVRCLQPLKPLLGQAVLDEWEALAAAGAVDQLFEQLMVQHYDPCYRRALRPHRQPQPLPLADLQEPTLARAARQLRELAEPAGAA